MAIKPKVKVTESHDYVRLTTPNSTFTMNRNGFSATGYVASSQSSFDNLSAFIDNKENGLTYGDRFKKLTDEAVIAKLFPEFDKDFSVGYELNDTVFIPSAPQYGNGIIMEIKKKNALVKFEKYHNQISVPFDLLEKLHILEKA